MSKLPVCYHYNHVSVFEKVAYFQSRNKIKDVNKCSELSATFPFPLRMIQCISYSKNLAYMQPTVLKKA